MRHTLGFWKTTVLGGVFFLLPFAIVLFLLAQLIGILLPAAEWLVTQLPDLPPLKATFGFVSLVSLVAVGLVLAACYVAGRLAQRSFARRFTGTIEKNLLLLFPRYAVLKDQFASNLGGGTTPQMPPVIVTFDDRARVGFEASREGNLVAVFLPGSPDPWQGKVVHVAADRVQPLGADFGAAIALCESLGRKSVALPPAADATSQDDGAGGSAR